MKMFSPFNEEWRALPRYFSQAKIPILQNIQLFVEFRDGINMIKDSKNSANTRHKITREIDNWRERSLPAYESVNAWSSILKNRLVICEAIKSVIANTSKSTYGVEPAQSAEYLWDYHYIKCVMSHNLTSKNLLAEAAKMLPNARSIPTADPSLHKHEVFFIYKERARMLDKAGHFDSVLHSLSSVKEGREFTKEQTSELWRMKGLAY
jgi:hypothetical protein